MAPGNRPCVHRVPDCRQSFLGGESQDCQRRDCHGRGRCRAVAPQHSPPPGRNRRRSSGCRRSIGPRGSAPDRARSGTGCDGTGARQCADRRGRGEACSARSRAPWPDHAPSPAVAARPRGSAPPLRGAAGPQCRRRRATRGAEPADRRGTHRCHPSARGIEHRNRTPGSGNWPPAPVATPGPADRIPDCRRRARARETAVVPRQPRFAVRGTGCPAGRDRCAAERAGYAVPARCRGRARAKRPAGA